MKAILILNAWTVWRDEAGKTLDENKNGRGKTKS